MALILGLIGSPIYNVVHAICTLTTYDVKGLLFDLNKEQL